MNRNTRRKHLQRMTTGKRRGYDEFEGDLYAENATRRTTLRYVAVQGSTPKMTSCDEIRINAVIILDSKVKGGWGEYDVASNLTAAWILEGRRRICRSSVSRKMKSPPRL